VLAALIVAQQEVPAIDAQRLPALVLRNRVFLMR